MFRDNFIASLSDIELDKDMRKSLTKSLTSAADASGPGTTGWAILEPVRRLRGVEVRPREASLAGELKGIVSDKRDLLGKVLRMSRCSD